MGGVRGGGSGNLSIGPHLPRTMHRPRPRSASSTPRAAPSSDPRPGARGRPIILAPNPPFFLCPPPRSFPLLPPLSSLIIPDPLPLSPQTFSGRIGTTSSFWPIPFSQISKIEYRRSRRYGQAPAKMMPGDARQCRLSYGANKRRFRSNARTRFYTTPPRGMKVDKARRCVIFSSAMAGNLDCSPPKSRHSRVDEEPPKGGILTRHPPLRWHLVASSINVRLGQTFPSISPPPPGFPTPPRG